MTVDRMSKKGNAKPQTERPSQQGRLTVESEVDSEIFLPASLFIHSDFLSLPEVLLIPGTTRGMVSDMWQSMARSRLCVMKSRNVAGVSSVEKERKSRMTVEYQGNSSSI